MRRRLSSMDRDREEAPQGVFECHVPFGRDLKLDIPDSSQDMVFVHFVIHDIPADRRPQVVKHLARKLVIGAGSMFASRST
jgi:hypothetical protein